MKRNVQIMFGKPSERASQRAKNHKKRSFEYKVTSETCFNPILGSSIECNSRVFVQAFERLKMFAKGKNTCSFSFFFFFITNLAHNIDHSQYNQTCESNPNFELIYPPHARWIESHANANDTYDTYDKFGTSLRFFFFFFFQFSITFTHTIISSVSFSSFSARLLLHLLLTSVSDHYFFLLLKTFFTFSSSSSSSSSPSSSSSSSCRRHHRRNLWCSLQC